MGNVGALRILSLAEFDPANVLSEHRAGLRRHGVDYRLAVTYRTTAHDGEVDWLLTTATYADLAELVDFAAQANVVQVAPAIGQPWSSKNELVTQDVESFGPLILEALPGAKLALFHGSVSLAAYGETYRDHFAQRGYGCWCCSPRWASRFGFEYVPAWVTRRGTLAAFRKDGEPLRVVHAPTDLRPGPGYQHTREVGDIARELGIELRVLHQQPHAAVWDAKREAHAAFSHLRGTFSVNTLESFALGIVPLFGWDRRYRQAIERFLPATVADPDMPWANGYWPDVSSLDDLAAILEALRDSEELTRHWQAASARFGQLWHAETLAPLLAERYRQLVSHGMGG